MQKTLNTKLAELRKDVVGVSDDSRTGRDGSKIFDKSEIDDIKVDGSEIEDDEVGKKCQKMSKNLSKSKKTIGSDFFILGAKLALIKLRQAFVKALILHHFNPKRHIRIETDVLGYVIEGIFSQLTLNDLGQWHPVAFLLQKMIPAENRYKTHDGELLAIVEPFKTRRHFLKGFHHEMLLLTNHNKLRRFIDIKSLSSKQVCWAQEFFCYHF